jgi:hypothetical protein
MLKIQNQIVTAGIQKIPDSLMKKKTDHISFDSHRNLNPFEPLHQSRFFDAEKKSENNLGLV